MDARIPLKAKTELCVVNRQKGRMIYIVDQEIGRGGSSLVYSGHYINNTGAARTVRIKECYPWGLRISREKTGALSVDDDDAEAFEEYKSRMREAFDIGNELAEASGLTNSVVGTIDLYDVNHTFYVISSYLEGTVLAPELFGSLKDAVTFIKSVAESIDKIHDRGYLYLDLKPDNLFVLKGTTELSVLFDFDSLIPLDRSLDKAMDDAVRLAFSHGFAAWELRTGRRDHIGKHTDVYGTGALFYYLLFEKAPEGSDCDKDAEYAYSHTRFAEFTYRDKLYQALTDFFHHTLPDYYPDRFQNMKEAVSQLAAIEKLADLSVPFICDSYIPKNVFMIGREWEEEQIREWFADNEKKCLFVTGMGGIGKSTLVRGCISACRKSFDSVLYLYYSGSLQRMIGDDYKICVNSLEKMEEESDGDYFKRKLICLKKLVAGTSTLLVIDDFEEEPGKDFVGLLDVGWKVIAITRSDVRAREREYETLCVGPIWEREALERLVCANLGREITDKEERRWLGQIIERFQGHTFILELVAKQMASSRLTAGAAAALAEKFGFSGLTLEKLDYVKDGKLYYDKLSNVITALFSVEGMSIQKRILMKVLSLFGASGLSVADFREMLCDPPRDLLYELEMEGWIQLVRENLSLHPVIGEAVRQWGWTEEYRDPVFAVLGWMYKKLRLEGIQEEYPKTLYRACESIKQMDKLVEEMPAAKKLLQNRLQKKGMDGEIAYERVAGSGKSAVTNRRLLARYLGLAENVLDSLRLKGVLKNTALYQDLLCCTILNMPSEREDFILSRSEELFAELDLRRANSEAVMRVYDYVVFLLCEKNEFEQASQKILSAAKLAVKRHSHFLWGMYYNMTAKYYGILMDKQSKRSRTDRLQEGYVSAEVLALEERALKKTVYHMRKSGRPERGQYITKCLLDHAVLLVKSSRESDKKISKMLDSAYRFMEEYVLDYSVIWQTYHLAQAWYYTLTEPNYRLMAEAVQRAVAIAVKRDCSELELMDQILIPCAGILMEWKLCGMAAEWLKTGIQICEGYPQVLPYVRKKLELYYFLLDIYFYHQKDFEVP